MLKEFQKEQQEMAKGLKALLAKGRSLRIRDLKEMLQEFRTQHNERLAHQIERRKDVNKMYTLQDIEQSIYFILVNDTPLA